jgi:hypothetical protein
MFRRLFDIEDHSADDSFMAGYGRGRTEHTIKNPITTETQPLSGRQIEVGVYARRVLSDFS